MSLTASVQVTTLCQSNQTVDNAAQLFCFWQCCYDLLMFNQCLCHVPEKHISVL
jgi:hypothetical protein